jgi:hypothetical protein
MVKPVVKRLQIKITFKGRMDHTGSKPKQACLRENKICAGMLSKQICSPLPAATRKPANNFFVS